MELFSLIRCPDLHRVVRSKRLVIDRPPPVVLDSFVPSLSVSVLWFVIFYIDFVFALGTLNCHIISWGKCIYVNDSTFRKDFVIN